MTCCKDHKHPDHSEQIANLNRISGQIEGVKKMILSNQYCVDILTQLKAVSSATKAVENKILEKHLLSCVVEAFEVSEKESKKKVQEIVTLLKKSR